MAFPTFLLVSVLVATWRKEKANKWLNPPETDPLYAVRQNRQWN